MRKITLLITLLFTCISAVGQRYSADTILTRYSLNSVFISPEKLYLHIDRTAYCAGETIWFNGYLRNASSEREDAESNYIYVELVRPDGSAEKRVKVKRSANSFPGYLFIPEDIATGKYTLKAYTLSQLDLPQDYYFHQEITVVGTEADSERRARKHKDGIDISFYPEGGRYFAGMPAKIGVKAMDSEGRSLDLSGKVVDDSGATVVAYETVHDGMGLIQFIPEAGRSFSLEMADGSIHPLPAPATEGATISVARRQDKLLVRVMGSGQYSLLLRDISAMRLVAELDLNGNSQAFIVPGNSLAEGINHLLLIDSKGRTVSERLFFEYGSRLPSAEFTGRAQGLGTREATTVEVNFSNADGSAFDGTCSVAVIGASLSPYRQDDGIDSYMLLSSELRGSIYDPRWYFDQDVSDKDRFKAMDLLMMIQGWSYYDLPTISDPQKDLEYRKHSREYTQFIRGKVERSFASKAPSNFIMTVLFPALGTTSILPVTQGKRFVLDSLSFEEGTGVMIKISRETGKIDYIPSWDGDEFAPDYKFTGAAGKAWKDTTDVPLEFVSTDTLKAAVVSASFSDDILGLSGHTLPKNDFKMYGEQTLIQYLMIKAPNFSYDGELMHNRRSAMLDGYGMTNRDASIWDESPVALVVDGVNEPWVGFENITINEIESITYSYEPNFIYHGQEGVVSIKLQYGTRVTHLSDVEPSLIYFIPLGYQTPDKFYAPRYDLGFSTTEEDVRNTLFWDPQVKVKDGKAEITFCTDDKENYPYFISIEGMSSDGEPFSASARL